MSDFWQNVWRYPRFLISSLAGLILILLVPFKNLWKIKKLRFFFPMFLVLLILVFYFIFVNMLVV